jgi:hypothetical protein
MQNIESAGSETGEHFLSRGLGDRCFVINNGALRVHLPIAWGAEPVHTREVEISIRLTDFGISIHQEQKLQS